MNTETDRELPFVSVVMPVRNEASAICESLDAVLRQDYPTDRYEVIVADGMSVDNTRQLVREFSRGRDVRIVDNPEKIAPTGLNAAIRCARGEVIVRVDGHCIVRLDYLRNCVALLRKHACPGVGGPVETIGKSTWAAVIASAMSSRFGVGGSAFRTIKDHAIWAETIPFPAYDRRIFEQVGLYDEELVRNQDDEFNARIRKAGGKLLLSPLLESKYFSRSTLRSLWRQYFQYGVWKVRVLQKHPMQMSVRHFLPAAFVLTLVLLAAGAPFHAVGAWGLATLLGLYSAGCLAAALLIGWRNNMQHVLLLPFAFFALHFGYGIGSLVGLWKFRARWNDRLGKTPFLVAIPAPTASRFVDMSTSAITKEVLNASRQP